MSTLLQNLRHGDTWIGSDGIPRTLCNVYVSPGKRGYKAVVKYWKQNRFMAMTFDHSNYLKKKVSV